MKKYTLITGGSSGLGKELALLYAKDNNNILLVATNKTKLEKVKEEITIIYPNIEVEYLIADLSKQEEREKHIEMRKKEHQNLKKTNKYGQPIMKFQLQSLFNKIKNKNETLHGIPPVYY